MKKIVLSTIMMLIFFSSSAQIVQSPFLEKYREMALNYNHDMKAAAKNITISMEYEKMARADRKPTLAGGANFQYVSNPMELNLNLPSLDAPIAFRGQNMNYGASVSLLQPLYTGGRLLESIRISQSQQSLAMASSEVIRSGVCFQTDIQYWNTVARCEMVAIATELRNSVKNLVTTIEERVEVGLADPQDLLMAQVKLNEAEYALLQAQSTFETGRMALNSLIGVELKSATQIDTTVPVVTFGDSLLISEGRQRAEIQMAEDRIKIAESSLKLSDSKYKPQFYVGADGNYSSPGYNFNADLNPNYALYAKLSVPIFEWGRRRSEKRASNQQIGIASDNLSKVEDQVNLEIETSRVALVQALERVDLAFSSLEKARENERMATERYVEGKISILEVLDAQTYRQNSQINFTQGKVAAQGYYSELIKALNGF